MPELPEVETIRRYLSQYLKGKTIKSVRILTTKLIKGTSPALFRKRISRREVINIRRRGKYLVFTFKPELYLRVHLKISGRFVYSVREHRGSPYQLAVLFTDGSILYYQDTRRFGGFVLADEDPIKNLELGPEPLKARFTLSEFKKTLSGKTSRIKNFLLDQRRIAGLGNIYATEALFHAGIHPDRKVSSLEEGETRRLYRSIKNVLKRAVSAGGTSIQDYLKPDGKSGKFQEHLFVYQRKGEPCRRCKSRIDAKKDGSRTTYFCPKCQK